MRKFVKLHKFGADFLCVFYDTKSRLYRKAAQTVEKVLFGGFQRAQPFGGARGGAPLFSLPLSPRGVFIQAEPPSLQGGKIF